MAEWDTAIAEATEYPHASIEDAVHRELVLLWSDLAEARRMAYKGRWSVGCDNPVTRIVQLSRAAGTWTPWQEISYPLLMDGTWQGITAAAGVTMPVPGEDDLRKMREWTDGQRLAVKSAAAAQ